MNKIGRENERILFKSIELLQLKLHNIIIQTNELLKGNKTNKKHKLEVRN